MLEGADEGDLQPEEKQEINNFDNFLDNQRRINEESRERKAREYAQQLKQDPKYEIICLWPNFRTDINKIWTMINEFLANLDPKKVQ